MRKSLILSYYCVTVRINLEVKKMTRISVDEVKHVANLARLRLPKKRLKNLQNNWMQLLALLSN